MVYFHADDYGMTETSSRRILECHRKGCMNSVSVAPNGCLETAAALLKKEPGERIICSFHINLVEGQALCSPEKLDLLVRPDGCFKHSFGGLLLLSLTGGARFREQLYREIRKQLETFTAVFGDSAPLRLDSHQHVHMIPVIFVTLLRAARDLGLEVEYLRIPVESLWPYLKMPALWLHYRPVNVLKVLVLDFLWLFCRPYFRRTGARRAVFCGVLTSGRMTERTVRLLLPELCREAAKKGMDLELEFHPGYAEPGDTFMDEKKVSFNAFNLSPWRKREHRALCSRLQGYGEGKE